MTRQELCKIYPDQEKEIDQILLPKIDYPVINMATLETWEDYVVRLVLGDDSGVIVEKDGDLYIALE